MGYFFGIVIAAALTVVFLNFVVKRITIREYERALKYTKGKFEVILEAGQHWYMPLFSSVQKIDVRPRFVSIPGQEILSADGVTLKVTIAANFEITDPNVAINKVMNFRDALYLEIQLAVREIVGAVDIDTLLRGRHEISQKLMETTEPKVAELGLNLISVNLKDIMFPGQLKELFAQVVNAKKEGLAAIEKARGESAALRSLANAAKLIDDNPNLMNLRLVQALGESSGNTFVLGLPSQLTPIPIPKESAVRKPNGKATG